MKKIDHLVLLVVRRELLTEEKRADFLGLADEVRKELGIPLENSVVFSDTAGSPVVGVLSHWRFASEEDLARFRDSRAHLDHLERMRPLLLEKQVIDLAVSFSNCC